MVLVSSFGFTYISPSLIGDLDNKIRFNLQGFDDWFFYWVMASAFVVVLGCAMEGPEILHELWPTVFAVFSSRWVKKVGLVGWLLVVLGVAGEGVFEVFEYKTQGLLQTFDEILLADAQRQAGDAKQSAEGAATAAQLAKDASGDAITTAKGARREADSFEHDIVSAKEQAAKAESDLAEALRQAAQAQAELNRLKTPRSLVHSNELIAALKPFSGTKYVLDVFMDGESIQFTKAVAAALDAAGWVRKQPAALTIGIPTVKIVLDQSIAENIPACLDTGISLYAHTKEPLSVLQSLPIQSLPKTVQAALAMKSAIAPSVSPPDERNVATGILDSKPAEGVPLTICVGKKP
jgi:hypothetical protein